MFWNLVVLTRMRTCDIKTGWQLSRFLIISILLYVKFVPLNIALMPIYFYFHMDVLLFSTTSMSINRHYIRHLCTERSGRFHCNGKCESSHYSYDHYTHGG